MKQIVDRTISKYPISVIDENDITAIQDAREKVAREVEELTTLLKAKETPEFQKVVMDSYRAMQMIERAAIMLNPSKPDFLVVFATLQGRFRERLSLTEEILNGRKRETKQRNLLEKLADRVKALRTRLQNMTQG